MNAVGVDASKGKSTVVIMKPFGEIVKEPFEVAHTASDLKKLADLIKSLDGEARTIMENTGKYHLPIAKYLTDSGLYVSAVHAKLIHDYGNNSLRNVKTDKADAMKIANYGLSNWQALKRWNEEDGLRVQLKMYSRQYHQYVKQRTMLKNNLISILDQTFPGINELFTSPARDDGHEKWIDFCMRFWHCECVKKHSRKKFTTMYGAWCRKNGYQTCEKKAAEIYALAEQAIPTLPADTFTKQLIKIAATQLNAIAESSAKIHKTMHEMASLLPEFPVVMAMNGVGKTLGPQLIAEIGDIRRFKKKESLVAFAGVDAPPYQSGNVDIKSRKISKIGTAKLRRALFLVMSSLLQNAPDDNVYRFLDRKRAEGKHYYSYMTAGCNKFLRIYYARVKEYLNEIAQKEKAA